MVQDGYIKIKNDDLCSSDNSEKKGKLFQEVYPFATEAVSEYFSRLDLKNKHLLTVGSSCDQAFNALVLGAKRVTIYDINANVEKFFKEKRKLILTKNRKELYQSVINIDSVPVSTDLHGINSVTRMNNYLQSDKNYKKLRRCLQQNRIDFINGNIFDFDKDLGTLKYDRIVLSNVLQYIEFFCKGQDPYLFLADNFSSWSNHLNDGGILQLLYLYGFTKEDLKISNHVLSSYNLVHIVRALKDILLDIEWIPSFNLGSNYDAIVTYTKKR